MSIPRILVVSDFHITSGKDRDTERWSPTEDFFWDEEFRDFLLHYTDGTPTTLIINGDLFDFIQVLVIPTGREKDDYRIDEEEIDRAYGLQCSEACSEFQIDQMMNGHLVFFNALCDFLIAGNEIKILKGNHDIQLHWPRVQGRIVGRLLDIAKEKPKSFDTKQIQFFPWFYYIPGLLYVEHGNQYEPTTAFRNFLYPLLPSDHSGRRNPQLELDLSSFLVRYLTNRLEPINQLADNIRPLTKYYGVMWKAHPYHMISTLGTAVKFVLKAFRKARQQKRGAKRGEYREINEKNTEMIREQAEAFSGGDQQAALWLEQHLRRFDDRRSDPTLEGGAIPFVWQIAKETGRGLMYVAPLYALTFIPDIGNWILDLIKSLNMGWLTSAAEFLHQSNLLHVLVIMIVGAILLAILRKRRKRGEKDPPSEVLPDVSIEMRDHAQYIARSLGVKYVTFGHTHYTDTCKLFDEGRYFNTGTWMGIFEEQEQLYREAHQFTFLQVENNDAWLVRWNADAKEPFPVVVVDTAPPLPGEEDSIVKLLLRAVKL